MINFKLKVCNIRVSSGGGGGGGGGKWGKLPPPPPKKKEKKKRREGRVREMWSLREEILFVGGVREREEKITEERERRNVICCMCRCHAHLPLLTKFSR